MARRSRRHTVHLQPYLPPLCSPRGVASLELVLALPVLVLVFLCILWVGGISFRQAQVTVAARDAAWRQRGETSGAAPFRFGEAGRLASAERSAQFVVSPVFRSFPSARSRHTVLVNAWDYRQIDLNSPPHWSQYIDRGRDVGEEGIASLHDLSLNVPGNLDRWFQDNVTGELAKLTNIFNVFQSDSAGVKNQIQSTSNGNRASVDRNMANLKQQRDDLKSSLQRLESRLGVIDKSLNDPNLSQSDRERLETERQRNQDQFRKDSEQLNKLEEFVKLGETYQGLLDNSRSSQP